MLAVRSPLQFEMSTSATAQDAYSRNHTGSEATSHHYLPPLTETLHRIAQDSPPLQSLQTMPVVSDSMLAPTANIPPVGYYTQVAAFADVPPPNSSSSSSIYSTQQDQQLSHDPSTIQHLTHDHQASSNPMMISQQPQHQQQPHPDMNIHQHYGRRVTYPFVPSIDTSSGLLVTNLASPENSGSSPLIGSPFTHGGLVGGGGVNSTPVPSGMVQASPIVGYMDAMTLHQQQHSPPSHPSQLLSHNGSYHSSPQQHSPATWLHNGDLMQGGDPALGPDGKTAYSFVPLSGVNSKKRPRRRFDEIERLYVCNWQDCEKSYGTLNHLNAHVNMQKHGPKRHPSGTKETMRSVNQQNNA